MRNYWKWIIGGIATILVVAMMVSIYKMATSPTPLPVATPAQEQAAEMLPEQAAPATTEPFIGSVVTRRPVNGLLVAEVQTPGPGSLHWEDSQGMLSSDSMTWEQPLIGDIELSPMGETTGLVPVLTTPQGVVKGNPIP